MNIIRRAYMANPGPDGFIKADAALSVAMKNFKRTAREVEATHCAVAFDLGDKNWRHAIYPAYKDGREPMHESLRASLAPFKLELAKQGFGVLQREGQEADDVISSCAWEAVVQGAKVFVSSTDKDFTYLIRYGVTIHHPFERALRDEAWCREHFGIQSHQILDWLALTGDKVDGVPGVDKVGATTATKLLVEYGDLGGVLAAAAEGKVKGVIGKNLIEQADRARLSRQLTDMRFDLYEAGLDWGAWAHRP